MAPGVQFSAGVTVNRKLKLVLAAILIPGGFVALGGALLVCALARSERGRRALDFAKKRVPEWATISRRTRPVSTAA